MCVNEEVVRLGLAKAEHMDGLAGNQFCLKLSQRLVKAELYAEKKGYGVWTRPSLLDRIKSAPSNAKQAVIGNISSKWHDLKLMLSWKRK